MVATAAALFASVWQEADTGDVLVREGDIDDSFFIITAGQADVSKQDTALYSLGAGDCFGEMGYLTKIRRTASVTAAGPLSVMKVNSTLIEQVTADCQLRFYKVFVRVLIERLSRTTDRVVRG